MDLRVRSPAEPTGRLRRSPRVDSRGDDNLLDNSEHSWAGRGLPSMYIDLNRTFRALKRLLLSIFLLLLLLTMLVNICIVALDGLPQDPMSLVRSALVWKPGSSQSEPPDLTGSYQWYEELATHNLVPQKDESLLPIVKQSVQRLGNKIQDSHLDENVRLRLSDKFIEQLDGIDKVIEAQQELQSTLAVSVNELLIQTRISKAILELAERERDEMRESSKGLAWTGMMAMSVKDLLTQMKNSSLDKAEQGRDGIQESLTAFAWSGPLTDAALWIANQDVVPVLVSALQRHLDRRILKHERKAIADFQAVVRKMNDCLHRTIRKAKETSQRFAELSNITDSMIYDLDDQNSVELEEKNMIIQDRGYLPALRNQLGISMRDTDSRDAKIALLKDQSLRIQSLRQFYHTEVEMLRLIISQHDTLTVYLDKETEEIREALNDQIDLTAQRADIIRSLQIINTLVERNAPGLHLTMV